MTPSPLALLSIVVLAGCSVYPNPSPSSAAPSSAAPSSAAPSTVTASLPVSTVAATPTLLPTPTAPPTPLVGDGAALDPAGDLVHDTGKPDDRPRYVDIEAIKGAADGVNLNLEMMLRTEPPTTRLNSVESLTYYFALDTTGDGRIDYLLELANYMDGRYHSVVEDWTGLEHLPQAFALVMSIDGRRVTASLPLASLRSPISLQFCALAMSSVPEGAPIFVKDYAPDGWCEGGDTDPVMISLT